MATVTVDSVARKIAALEISSKSNTGKPGHAKQPSQTNVSKLLTKFAAPNLPPPNFVKPPPKLKTVASQSSLKSSQTSLKSSQLSLKTSQSSIRLVPQSSVRTLDTRTVDIGQYDGGFEKENDSQVDGVDNADLALDSSTSAKNPTRVWSLHDFEMGKPMGKGKFGHVYMVRTKVAPNYVIALKTMYKKEIIENHNEKQIRREIEIQQNLRHPNVIRLYGYFHDKNRIFLMLEFAGKGELYRQLSKQGSFTEKRSSRYIDQMTDALMYLHSKHVMHRDIKPENLLLGMNGELKIADFGWSVHAPGNRRSTMCGTLDYLPPEIVLRRPYDNRVDHWALGVLTFEFLNGFPPFEDKDQHSTCRRIAKLDYRMPSKVSPEAADVIRKLLVLNPNDRADLADILKHPWLIKYRPEGTVRPSICE